MRRFIMVVALLLFPAICWSNSINGVVRHVIDGDTLKVFDGEKLITVRLYGLDAPEKNQRSGRQATHMASLLALGQMAEIKTIDTDRYGRVVGIVDIEGNSLNESLLKAGYAWVYPRYCKEDFCAAWKEYEAQARDAKIGLWVDEDAISPWEYRRGK